MTGPGEPLPVSPPGCARCADPLAVALQEQAVQCPAPHIAVFRCPACGCLILDDAVGFKGAGTVLRVTPAMIDSYVRGSARNGCGYQYGDEISRLP